jgi:hypothetical protein
MDLDSPNKNMFAGLIDTIVVLVLYVKARYLKVVAPRVPRNCPASSQNDENK